MKKVLSLILALMMVMTAGVMAVSAADVSSTYLDGDSFFYSFESESDLSHAGMKFDEQGTGNFQDENIKKYTTPGANGSNGAVGIHVETAVNNGNTGAGVMGFTMYPGVEYELTFKIKLFSRENLKAAPQMGVFFMTSNAEVFKDEACTQSEGKVSNRYQYTTHNLSTVIPVENGVVSGDWCTYTTKVSIGNKFSSGYVPAGKPVPMNMFLRIGGVHALTDNIYTDEFNANCGTHTSGSSQRKSYWLEYALDDVGLRRVSYEEAPKEDVDPALWRVDFEDSSWTGAVPSANVHYNYASKTTIVNDVPAAIADTSKGAVEATYSQHNGNNGYMEFNIYASNPAAKMQYNRAYHISFWMKGSEAMAKYYADTTITKGKSTQIIPERGSTSRLNRVFPKWTGYSLPQAVTTEWKKYDILWYEKIPGDIAMSEEATSDTKFHVRTAAVPGTTDANYTYTSPDGVTYGISDFKVYLDEFVVTPLDIAFNGDFARNGSDTDFTSIYYNGETNAQQRTENRDVISAGIFGSGTITEDASFAAASGIDNKNVLKVKAEDAAPSQIVHIEDNVPYRISFWAKADDEASVGKPIHTVLDRDIIGEIRDNQETVIKDAKTQTEVTVNTDHYDGYGNLTGKTGSVPNYFYSGTLENTWHKPGVLGLNSATEALVYDDFYDRAFSKNTQAGKAPTAFVYQYYNGSEWVNANEANYETTNVLSSEWKYYEMDYQWDYEGKHYRLPELVIDADANYSLANIKVEDISDVVGVPAEFTAENIKVVSNTGSNRLSTGEEFTVTWDLVSTNGIATEEAAGTLVKVYADTETPYLIGTAKADKLGEVTLTATNELFGKDLRVEVIPKDVNGDFGIPASTATGIKVVYTVETAFKLAAGETSVDWSATVKSAGETASANAYVASYDANGQLIDATITPLAISDGVNTISGNVPFSDSAVKLKLFLWDTNYAPLIEEKTINMHAVNKDPFAGDNTINIAYLGDSLYAGAGASSNAEKWVYQVGAWFEETYEKDGVTVNNFYKGAGGTTTEYSAARLYRDIIANDPDLVFFSHTCNDGNRDTRRNMEFVVRSLMQMENPPYIVFTRSTNRGLSESNGYGNQVANHYNLPLIDDRDAYIRALAKNGNTMADYFIADGVHPNDLGYDVITEEVIARMQTGRYYVKATEPVNKLLDNSGAITSMTNFCSNDARVTATGFTAINGGMKSTAVGDTLSFSFTGNVLAFSYGLNQYGCKLEVYVDDKLVSTINPYYPGLTSNMLVGKENSIIYDLDNGTHNVVVKTVTGQDTSSAPQTVVYDIFTGTWVK